MADVLLDTAEIKGLLAHALRKELTEPSYNSPIKAIVGEVIEEHRADLLNVMQTALRDITSDKEFADILRQEAKHKIAKQLVSEITSTMGKAINAFKQNPVLKADMVKAIEKIIESSETE